MEILLHTTASQPLRSPRLFHRVTCLFHIIYLQFLFIKGVFSFSTALKYVQQTLEVMKHRTADSDEDPSILGIY
jgi:hypothetical protein